MEHIMELHVNNVIITYKMNTHNIKIGLTKVPTILHYSYIEAYFL